MGLPRHRPEVIAATDPWQRGEKPITRRERRNDLTKWRQDNPLPIPSPFWKEISF